MKKNNIMKEDWDFLVIVDACRYDYFKKVYRKYLRGRLEKRISLGHHTLVFCKNTFQRYYDDVIYISSSPYINGKGVKFEGWKAKDHFYKIVDVWDKGWDKEKRTVLPEVLSRFALREIKKNKNKRFIIHYMQPHYPYLSGSLIPKSIERKFLKQTGEAKKPNKTSIRFWVGDMMIKLFGEESVWMVRKIMKEPPRDTFEYVWRYHRRNMDKLKILYYRNLEIVLKEVVKFINKLPEGKIVITSDHGEGFGEHGVWLHNKNNLRRRILIEVPWFEVERK